MRAAAPSAAAERPLRPALKPLPRGWLSLLLTALLAFAGNYLALIPWSELYEGSNLPLAGLVVVAALWARRARTARWVRWLCLALAVAALGSEVAFAFIFFSQLSWTLSAGVKAGAAAALLGALATRHRRWRFAELPLSLPFGLITLAALSGWEESEAWVDCDDYLAATAQPGVRVLVPTNAEVPRCREGERVEIQRYPRHFWEDPDGTRFVVTTQLRNRAYSDREAVPGRFPGAICSVDPRAEGPAPCVGFGIGQAIEEAPNLGRLFIGSWAQSDEVKGALWAIPMSGPIEVLGHVGVDDAVGEIFYDAADDMLGAVHDSGHFLYQFRGADMSLLGVTAAPVAPGETEYDLEHREGIYCFAAGPLRTLEGGAYAAVAFSMAPYRHRPLASSNDYPWMWGAFVWGCDFDPVGRRAYIAVANLGLLLTVDYDTGAILHTQRTGFGLRSLDYDPRSGMLYAVHFLDGTLLEIDPQAGELRRSWFVGRYSRYVRVSRDGTRVFASSTLGLIEVALGATEQGTPGPQ